MCNSEQIYLTQAVGQHVNIDSGVPQALGFNPESYCKAMVSVIVITIIIFEIRVFDAKCI